MSFVTHGSNQRAYESLSSVWSGPQKQGLKRAGRWLNSQAPQPPRPAQTAESVVWSRLPVLEATELQHWATSSDAQPPRPAFSWYVARKLDEFAAPGLPVELLRFIEGVDGQAPHPGLSWSMSPQIPNPVAGAGMPIELVKFTVNAAAVPRFRESTPFWWTVQRQGVKRAGRWVTSQPRQPRIVPESSVQRSNLLLVAPVNLPEQLRRFVLGQPFQPHATEASWTQGVKIPNPPPAGTNEELRRVLDTVARQLSFTEASAVYHVQIPTNADLYAVRRAFASFVGYRNQFDEGSAILPRTEAQVTGPVLPIELQIVAVNADAQPVQRAQSALWIPQLQAAVTLGEELRTFTRGQDPVVFRQVLSWFAGVQIPNPLPPLPIELQQFVVGTDAVPTQRGQSSLLARYMPDTFVMPIELLNFTVGDPRQPPLVPESRLFMRKLDELVPMPTELRHYVETAFQRYRSHYLILRGSFDAVPVPDVVLEFKYFRGYTIIAKKTRLN